MRFWTAQSVVSMLVAAGCSTATSGATVDDCERYGEAVFPSPTVRRLPLDWRVEDVDAFELVFVVEPELRPKVEDVVHGLAKSFVQPRLTDRAFGPYAAQEEDWLRTLKVRVRVMSAADVTELLPCLSSGSGCEQISLPAVEYLAEPYGYGTDEGAFSAALHCLVSNSADNCGPVAATPFRSSSSINIVWVTDQDVCAVAADGCSEFRQLNQLADGSHGLVLSVIAAVPPQLVAAHLVEGDWYASTYADLLANPALPSAEQTVPCESRSSDAHVPRNLIAQLQSDTPIASLCEPDPSESTLAVDIRLHYEGGDGGFKLGCNGAFARLTPAADGTVPCAWNETLPIAGPITHCTQLSAYGRQPLAVESQTGAEICRIEQLAFTNGSIQGDQGYAYVRMSDVDGAAIGFKPWCLYAREDAPRFWVPRDFVPVPGSWMRMACTTQDDMTCR